MIFKEKSLKSKLLCYFYPYYLNPLYNIDLLNNIILRKYKRELLQLSFL